MTFAPIPAHDYPAIARAIAAERRAKPLPDLRTLSAEARRDTEIALREDPHIWAAIVDWCDWLALPPRDRRPNDTRPLADRMQPMLVSATGNDPDEAEYLAKVTLRTAAAALRRWHADGQPGGEAEARAFKMFNLARRFAELVRHPHPTFDAATGEVVTPDSPAERKAA